MWPFLAALPDRREAWYLSLLFMDGFVEERIPTPLHGGRQHARTSRGVLHSPSLAQEEKE